jgi:RNase P subunit RPR2
MLPFIGHAFVIVVPCGLRRSFCQTCCRITGHPRRIRFRGQSNTLLGNLGGAPRRRPRASADPADIVQREQSVGAPAELYGADN